MSQYNKLFGFLAVALALAAGFQNCAPNHGLNVSNSSQESRPDPQSSDSFFPRDLSDSIPGAPNLPSISFSASLNGERATQLVRTQTYFGKITGVGSQNIRACAEQVNQGVCSNMANWSSLPNADWSWQESDKSWRATFNTLAQFPNGQYKMYVSDPNNNVSIETLFSILDAMSPAPSGNTPQITFSHSFNGTPITSSTTQQVVYGKVTNLPATNVIACAEPAGSGNCSNMATWSSFPNQDWSYNNMDGTWRMQVNFSNLSPGQFNMYIRDTVSGKSAQALLTLVAPSSGGSSSGGNSGGTQVKCSWHGLDAVIGPCSDPETARSCTQSNMNQEILGTGSCKSRYRCLCN